MRLQRALILSLFLCSPALADVSGFDQRAVVQNVTVIAPGPNGGAIVDVQDCDGNAWSLICDDDLTPCGGLLALVGETVRFVGVFQDHVGLGQVVALVSFWEERPFPPLCSQAEPADELVGTVQSVAGTPGDLTIVLELCDQAHTPLEIHCELPVYRCPVPTVGARLRARGSLGDSPDLSAQWAPQLWTLTPRPFACPYLAP